MNRSQRRFVQHEVIPTNVSGYLAREGAKGSG